MLVLPARSDLKPAAQTDADAFARLSGLVSKDMAEVNELIISRMNSSVPMIPAVASHLIKSGGKRLRPVITLAAARLCGYEGTNHLKLAAAVEFIHTATLLHDDVVDASVLRRGQDSANVVWGNQASVLVGDFLFSRSFNLMVEIGDIKTLDILSTASSIIAEGEVMQLTTNTDIEASGNTYLEIVKAKTAALFAAASRSGGVVAKCSRNQELALETFGENFGIAFQLTDDALDYNGQQFELGKTLGDDFREGKITLPVILAYEKGNNEERAFWRRVIEDVEQNENDFAQAISLLKKHDTLEETLCRAREFGDTARIALRKLPKNAYRDALDDVIDFCIERAY
ncbi:MAG: polyprenyl synthetase family protein [Alphaproteobacteria bacterium]|nr:MAG: polyprenyl synthetase family protein [Alphaproteobacteria bacterium]